MNYGKWPLLASQYIPAPSLLLIFRCYCLPYFIVNTQARVKQIKHALIADAFIFLYWSSYAAGYVTIIFTHYRRSMRLYTLYLHLPLHLYAYV